MTPERHRELDNSGGPLTQRETDEGWRFCSCEWDGLLICAGDPEAKFCHCFYDDEGNLK